MRPSLAALSALSFGCWLAAATARADGLDAHVLIPAPVGRGTVAVPSADTLPVWDLEGSLVLSFADDPLELSSAGGQRLDGVVDRMTVLDVSAAVGLPAHLEAAVRLPVVLHAAFAGPYRQRSGAAAGDLGLGLRWRAFAQGRVAVATALDVTVPTGDRDRLVGAAAPTIAPAGVGVLALGPLRLSALAGLRLLTREATFAHARQRSAMHGGLSAELALERRGRLRASLEAVGSVDLTGRVGAWEGLAAVRWVGGTVALELGTGVGLTDGIGAPDFRVLGGASFRSARRHDADDDGVVDARDRCPTDPEDRDGHDDADGCPDPDDDGDGVADGADRCPAVAEDPDGWQDADGCPDTDNDGDGVPDERDRCRSQAEEADGHEDDDGCPDLDDDGDGIADAADHCPRQAETANGFQDDDGCPDEAPRYVFRPRERIVFNNIVFRTSSDELLRTSLPVLDEVAASLRAQPTVRVRIEGHTDDRGPDDRNLALSQRRALSVMNYLIGAGTEPSRLEYAGFGETRPVEANSSAEGRAKNRRVEFVTLDQE